jgi:protein-disulfide isomerase
MKFFASFLFILVFSFVSFAQTNNEILATANSRNFTAQDLPSPVGENYQKLPAIISGLRTELLSEQIAEILLKDEATARKVTVEKMIEAEMQKRVTAPTEAQIQAVFEANRQAIGNRTLAEVRPQIVSFLRREPEQKAMEEFVGSLKTKHKVVIGKDVNAQNLTDADVLATINGKSITVQSFNEKAKRELYEAQMDVYEQVEDALEQVVYSSLISAEAKSLGIQPEDLIAREISDKMRSFTNDERAQLETAFQKRLFQKYNAKILLKAPAPFIQNISIPATSAARGSTGAPVTVVMFTDFQCPACGAAHPSLEKLLAEYGADRVRFVVRNFPLTQIHENALKAAQAAAAANAQGKFFEYAELLYKNQNSLDTVSLKRFAAEAGLNQKQFDADLDSGKYAEMVKKDMADGMAYGIGGTPTIYVNGVRVRQLSPDAFRKAIERALKK